MKNVPEGHRKRRKVYNTPYHAHFLTFSCYRRQAFFSCGPAPRRFLECADPARRGTPKDHACGAGMAPAPQWFLECVDLARREAAFHLWAFVIMPEHVHLVIAPGESYDIGNILRRIKRTLTYRIVEHVKTVQPAFLERMAHRQGGGKVTHRFWQRGGGYDRNLWSPAHIHKMIRYVHENPVRRGLVERPEDWPWTSYRTWMGGEPEPIRLDLQDVPTIVV
jgi:putative transposase